MNSAFITASTGPRHQDPRHHGEPDSGKKLVEFLGRHGRLCFFDMVTEVFAQLRDFMHGHLAILVHGGRHDRLVAESDAQAARIGTDFFGERSQRWRRIIRGAGIGAGSHIQHQCIIEHATGDDVLGQQAGSADVTIVIPPRRSAVSSTTTDGPWAQREAALQKIRETDRREWQKESGYRQQARVQNGFFRFKSVLGGSLKARNSNAQTREAMIGCHVLNRMTAIGRPESYPVSP